MTEPLESENPGEELQCDKQEDLAGFFMANRDRLRRMVDLRMDKRLAQRVDASDILQEGFVEAQNRFGEYLEDPKLPLFVWLRFLVGQRLLAVNRWHFGRQKRDPRKEQAIERQPTVGSEVMAREFSAHLTSPSQAAAQEELASRLTEMLDEMDEMDREILTLRHFEELSNNEAAAELGLTKAAASKRYIRALSKLRAVAQDDLEDQIS